jgi:adenylate cyclase
MQFKPLKRRTRHFWVVTGICGGIAVTFLVMLWTGKELGAIQHLETYTEDFRMSFGRHALIDTNLLLVGIDRPEYSVNSGSFSEEEVAQNPDLRLLQKNWPWSRKIWAQLITKLADAKAKVIVIDLVFGAEGDGDEELRAALDKYRSQIVIGCNIHDLGNNRGDSMTLDVPNPTVLSESSTNLFGYDDRIGYVNIWPDDDEVLRYARYRLDSENSGYLVPKGAVLESMDARAIRKYGFPEKIPATTGNVRFRFAKEDGAGYHIHPLSDIFSPKTWQVNYQNGEFFRGKIVMVGPTADIFQDFHKIPGLAKMVLHKRVFQSQMLGPEIHLNIIGAALHGEFLTELEPYQEQLAIAIAGLMATLLSFLVRLPFRRLGMLVMIGLAYLYISLWVFDHFNLIIPIARPVLVLTISGVMALGYDYFREQVERTRVRKNFERYVSKNIVKELLDNQESYLHSLEGVRRPVCILFSDVRGFTTMTESADPGLLVKQLNEYFGEMVTVVFANEGTLDKFIGDAVMAVWGNILTPEQEKDPQRQEKDARNAVSTALAMKRSLAKLNVDWKKRGMQELRIGIGINHGDVICGNMGSSEKMETTVIGDAVNTASRLEGLTKKFHLDLLLGESTARLVKDRFILRTVGLIQPKGKTVPAEVFTVLGELGANADAILMKWNQDYEAGVRLFRSRSFVAAIQQFEICLAEKPNDPLCEIYIEECNLLIKSPPPESWNGAFVMTEK